MKSKKNGFGILIVAIASALAIGVFSFLFIGVNNLAFGAAENRTIVQATVPSAPSVASMLSVQAEEPTQYQQEEEYEPAVFVPPNVTVLLTQSFAGDVPPSHALTAEEAAMIGAEYIWEVLGSCIDGMYVEMMYIVMPGFTRPFWIGSVTETEPPRDLNFEDFRDRDDMDGWLAAQVFAIYHFRVDAITGMRVDVGYLNPSYLRESIETDRNRPAVVAVPDREEREAVQSLTGERTLMHGWEFRAAWMEMDTDEQLALSDITVERLSGYKRTALALAERHFNDTIVTNIRVGDSWVPNNTLFAGDVLGEGDDMKITITGITFTATDCTGRELIIYLPTETANWRRMSVSSMHNEFIPGFSYDPENRNMSRG